MNIFRIMVQALGYNINIPPLDWSFMSIPVSEDKTKKGALGLVIKHSGDLFCSATQPEVCLEIYIDDYLARDQCGHLLVVCIVLVSCQFSVILVLTNFLLNMFFLLI